MKLDQDDRFGGVKLPRAGSLERLQPPEIVGQVGNPVLEAVRRFWWRAFDRVCDCIALIRLSIHDWIYGLKPPTSADGVARDCNILRRSGTWSRMRYK